MKIYKKKCLVKVIVLKFIAGKVLSELLRLSKVKSIVDPIFFFKFTLNSKINLEFYSLMIHPNAV